MFLLNVLLYASKILVSHTAIRIIEPFASFFIIAKYFVCMTDARNCKRDMKQIGNNYDKMLQSEFVNLLIALSAVRKHIKDS